MTDTSDILQRLTDGHADLNGDDYWTAIYADIRDARTEIARLRAHADLEQAAVELAKRSGEENDLLRARLEALAKATKLAIQIIEILPWENGNTGPSGTPDEGVVLTGRALAEIRAALAAAQPAQPPGDAE